MDKAALEARIKALELGLARIKAEIHATDEHASALRGNLAMTTGALEECMMWLSKIDEGGDYPKLKAIE